MVSFKTNNVALPSSQLPGGTATTLQPQQVARHLAGGGGGGAASPLQGSLATTATTTVAGVNQQHIQNANLEHELHGLVHNHHHHHHHQSQSQHHQHHHHHRGRNEPPGRKSPLAGSNSTSQRCSAASPSPSSVSSGISVVDSSSTTCGSGITPNTNNNNNHNLVNNQQHQLLQRITASPVPRDLGLRLDQPVTNSSFGMETKKMVPTPVQVTTGLQHHLHHPNLQQQQQQQQLLMQQQLQQQQQQQQLLVQQSSKQPSQQQQPRGKGGGDGGGEGGGLSLSGVRRRSGHQQGLRSPAAKRPISAPVALQGWLYKQGSEGLMLWKKRWFVLSEYCLFYYKGPEEEKLLGSILLPSYQVTVCHAEDKVTKKFAFKAEHANMRTYHFAAESRESMSQWVNALTLASLVQDPNPAGVNAANNAGPTATGDDRSARPSLSSVSSTVNQSADDSDSGFHGFQSRDDPSHTSNNNSSPNSVNTGFPANSNDNYNKLHNNNFKNDPQQPLMNGMMHPQQSDYRSQQMMDSQSPYGHLLMRPGVISPTGEHQHQTLIYQQHPQLAQQMQMIQQLKHEGQMSQQQQQQKTSPSGNNVNTVQPTPRNYGQPVYANAPPKPRRLNENPNDFSTPSPESDYHKSPMSPEARLGNKGPMTVTEFLDARNSNSIYGQRMTTQPSLRTDKSGLTYGFTQPLNGQPAERRTPDTYGRSNAKPISRQQMRNGLDYEDVYSNPPPQLYQKPAGPVGYVKDTTPTSNPMALYTQHQPQQKPQQLMNPQYYVVSGLISNGEFSAPVMRQQQPPRSEQPPRPHSADFLEYEASRRPNLQTNTESGESVGQQRCPQRPKSSLDVVNPSDLAAINDKYFYSEERYAAQMRQSAVYLHQTPPQQQQQQAQTAQSRNQSLPRATTPSKSTASRDNESGIGTLSEMSNSSVRRSRKKHYSEQPAAYSLQRHTELTTSEQAHLRRSLRETRGPVQHGQYSPGRSLPRDYSHAMPVVGPGFEDRRLDQQQFARSASARLPRSRHPSAIIDYDDDDDDDESYGDRNMSQNIKDGDRKIQQREESMKRLLEWKQRMLQSPLTRKPTVSSNGSNQRNQHNSDLANCYKQQALLELAAHEASLTAQTSSHRHRRRDNTHHMRSHYPRSKSTDAHRSESAAMNDAVGNHNAFPRYSSYSSDDEASGSGSMIGRDPLPPRAVSTSQLTGQQDTTSTTAQQPLKQPDSSSGLNGVNVGHSTTLPRSTGVKAPPAGTTTTTSNGPHQHHLHQQQQHLMHKMMHHHQQQQQPNGLGTNGALLQSTPHLLAQENDYANHVPRAVSSEDIRISNELRDPMMASPSRQRYQARSNSHLLRVISPVDHTYGSNHYQHHHRMSSPSDSERQHAQSLSDRDCSTSNPVIYRDSELRASNPSLRQMQRNTSSRQSGEQFLYQSRNHLARRSSSRGGGHGSSTNSLVQVSAGELLNRTHEELVLLLIQLRRQSATLCKAMETCHMEIEAQARLVELDTPRRLENLMKLDELKKNLMDLEKQYEKGKPLVNLVDNMVKLGSLYNCNGKSINSGILGINSLPGSRYELSVSDNAQEHRDRVEFNQRVQEQKLLAEERRDWDRLSPDHGQLQAKVQQLYKLDQLLQEESGTLHNLQQKKELLEKTLSGLRHKMQNCSRTNPAEAERYREQQLLLERDLSQVRLLLAHKSKKLEETVAQNARLEQELVVLRQKLQASRRYASNVQQTSAMTTPARDSGGSSVALEKELRRVQQLVGDLQRQRQELSFQVKQLTEKSHNLVQQIKPQSSSTPQVHQSSKKRTPTSWLETDLDSGVTQKHSQGVTSPSPSLSKLKGRVSPYNHSPYQQPQQPPMASPHFKDMPNPACSPVSTSSSSSSRYCNRQAQNQALSHQNGISGLSPQLREQIQQHQQKQQLLKDQIQGKSINHIQDNGIISNGNINNSDNYNNNSSMPLYVNSMVPDPRRIDRNYDYINGGPLQPPEYIPPPAPTYEDTTLLNGDYGLDDGKFSGLMHNREKQEIKTVRIVKRESERRQRDRGDRSNNIDIPLSNGHMAMGGPKRLEDEDYGGSQLFDPHLDRVIEETPVSHAQSSDQLANFDDMQFQRSMSLPRGFGGQIPNKQTNVNYGPVPPPPRSDSMTALRNLMTRRHRSKLDYHQDPTAGSSDSTLSPYSDSPTYPQMTTSSPISPGGVPCLRPYPVYGNIQSCSYRSDGGSTLSVVTSPEPEQKIASSNEALSSASLQSLNRQLSPVFKSEAAKQIIKEMTEKKPDRLKKRQNPRDKRRYYTVSSSKPLKDLEDSIAKMGMGRARDDLDMERALRPRINAPDVVSSTLSHKEFKYNESTIDSLLGTPNKIVIPERYVPEKTPELTAEEKEHRLKKAESIRKMLSETTIASADGAEDEPNSENNSTLKKKVAEEKKQREHILQLNQILAKQVMEKSKMVAASSMR